MSVTSQEMCYKRGVAEPNALPFELQPIKRIETFRAALEQVTSLVERLEPGDRLGSERELAEQLHVSRVTVREVLRALEGMGKVEIRRNSGTYVAHPAAPRTLVQVTPPDTVDEEYVRQLGELRACIECQILRLAAQQDPLDLAPAEAALARAERQIEKDSGQGRLDASFEAALAQAAGNPVLSEFQRAIHELWLHAAISLGGAIGKQRHLHAEHLDILDALKNGQVEMATQKMHDHIMGRRDELADLPGSDSAIR
jgi:GntR family transcriptional repressor for pyruvate dehydrogenase complex